MNLSKFIGPRPTPGYNSRVMTSQGKINFSPTEMRSLKAKETKVYLKSVMEKLFRTKWEKHYKGLLAGNRETLDLCASHLNKNLDLFPLLHTLCLITGQKFDLEEKDPAKAADLFLVWFEENKGKLKWDKEWGSWKVKA